MRSLKRLLVPVAVAAALVGLSLPAGAEPVSGPLEGDVAVEGWSRPLRVPVPPGRIEVAAAAISNRGHIAVAYRNWSVEGEVPGYVIVRSPRGVWGAPHRLNPRHTDIAGVEVAFDRAGNLTALWAFAVGSEGCCGEPRPGRFRVATKPAGRAWSAHLPNGMVEDAHFAWELGLSVAPSGRAAISWWRSFEPGADFVFKLQFKVRVRSAADAPWGRARALSPPVAVNDPRFGSRGVDGDVVINNDGSGMAVWSVGPLENDRFTYTIRRSMLRSSGAWTAPVTFARNVAAGFYLASTPVGFTGMMWVRQYARPQTVVALRTPDGIWSRGGIPGVYSGLAVGPRGKVVIVDGGGLRVTWRSNRADWTTTRLARGKGLVFPLEPAIDRTGRVFVPWAQRLGATPKRRVFMSTHVGTWDTTMLWGWERHADLAAADVSLNGRAVAIRTVLNVQETTTTAVVMRVLRPT